MKMRGCKSEDHKLFELRNQWHRTTWDVHKESKDQKKNPFIISPSNSTQKQLYLPSILIKYS